MGEPDVTKLYDNLPDNSHGGRIKRDEKQSLTEGKRAEKIIHGKVKNK